ncbi:MAG TPA: FkbM family methyltransferase [Rhizomicrobium sp.]|nr:FkbM family methyltransferase [Rhizomicrobium sp.]
MTSLSRRARQKLLLSPRFPILAEGPLTYLDVGARGDLDEPWSLMPPQSLLVVGFEPDAQECAQLNASVPSHLSRRYYPSALWSQDTVLNFSINVQPSTSSAYPANMAEIKRFAAPHVRPRETARTAAVPATTLDAIVAQHGLSPDFLKLDTQGAEFPILMGAKGTLSEHAIAVITETWTMEVYQGQTLSGEILTLLHQAGFSVFDFNLAAAWNSHAAAEHGLAEKPQLVGLDFLFIRRDFASRSKVIKAAAVADIFGFPGAAIDMLDTWLARHPQDTALLEAKAHILACARVLPLAGKMMRFLRRLTGRRESDFARLH